MNRKTKPFIIFGLLIVLLVSAFFIFPEVLAKLCFAIFFMLVLWFFYHFIPAVLLSSPFWIWGRHRAQWMWWEFSILIVPYFVWVSMFYIHDRGKDIPNIVEMFWLGCALGLAAIIRVAIASYVNRKIVASILIVVYCVAAIILWEVVAPIPLSK